MNHKKVMNHKLQIHISHNKKQLDDMCSGDGAPYMKYDLYVQSGL